MAYVERSKQDHVELQPEFKAAIELMHLLNLAGASLTLYEKLFDWHIEYLGATKKVEEKTLLNRLRKRYNMEATMPYEVKCELPVSGVHFKGKPWHDWAMFRFREEEEGDNEDDPAYFPDDPNKDPAIRPAHIRCFIDLTMLPAQNTTRYSPSIYMITETVTRNRSEEEQIQSELFQPYVKNTQRKPGTNIDIAKMEVLSVEKMTGPACLIPDLDNKNARAILFHILLMTEWVNLFELWVNDTHTREF